MFGNAQIHLKKHQTIALSAPGMTGVASVKCAAGRASVTAYNGNEEEATGTYMVVNEGEKMVFIFDRLDAEPVEGSNTAILDVEILRTV